MAFKNGQKIIVAYVKGDTAHLIADDGSSLLVDNKTLNLTPKQIVTINFKTDKEE